jgi:hypothetical protein
MQALQAENAALRLRNAELEALVRRFAEQAEQLAGQLAAPLRVAQLLQAQAAAVTGGGAGAVTADMAATAAAGGWLAPSSDEEAEGEPPVGTDGYGTAEGATGGIYGMASAPVTAAAVIPEKGPELEAAGGGTTDSLLDVVSGATPIATSDSAIVAPSGSSGDDLLLKVAAAAPDLLGQFPSSLPPGEQRAPPSQEANLLGDFTPSSTPAGQGGGAATAGSDLLAATSAPMNPAGGAFFGGGTGLGVATELDGSLFAPDPSASEGGDGGD